MSQTLILLWGDYGASGATILAVAFCGFLIVFHETRTQRAAAVHIANWMWDAERVDQFHKWSRAGLIEEGSRRGPDGVSISVLGVREVNEADLILFDTLELRHLQARQIEALLHGQRCDKSLMEAERVIEASIGRRRWRMSNHQPTPGVAQKASVDGLVRNVGFNAIDGKTDIVPARSAMELLSEQRADQESDSDSVLSLHEQGAKVETQTGDEGDPYMRAFGAHLAGIVNSGFRVNRIVGETGSFR